MPLTLILLLSCQGDTGNITLGTTTDSRSRDSPADTEPAPPRTLRFADVGYPASEEERRVPRASTQAWLDDEPIAISYQTLLRTRQSPDGDGVFGRLHDITGAPILNSLGVEDVSPSIDASSLHETASGALVMLTHVETSPGALYRTDLTQDPTTGQLTATATTNLDLAHLNGLSLPCASSITPWGTHLAGEEYPPDARRWQNAINWTDLPANTKNFARYWGHDVYTDVDEDRIPDNLVWADLRAEFDPYRYGTPFEATVTDDDTVVVRHPSMGRTSVELALVLPDQRTAFITDDESNAVLYLYVADTAGDLSAGTLYAMVWTQTSDDGAGEADLTWISLGHATDAEITAAVDGGVTFSDLFDVSLGLFDPKTGEARYTCPRTLTAVHTSTGFECLRVKDGMAVLASRLETDRYAAMLGATAELRKAEGITYDPDHERVYLAISEIDEGMESHAAAGWDDGGPDHVRLQENICGVVYALDLAPDALVGSDHVPVHASELLSGKPREFRPHLSPYARDDCDATRIANPDNIHYLPGYGVLFVAEDTREQQNDSVWAYDVNDEVLTRIFTTPYEAEATGIYTYTLGDWSYLKVVVHDPYGVRGGQDPETPDDIEGYDGVIGPLPAL